MVAYRVYCGERKHSGGKIVKVCIEVDDKGLIRRMMVTGDFFVEPEDFCERVEAMLKNVNVEGGLSKAKLVLVRRVRELRVKFHGVNEEDFIEALSRAFNKALTSR